MREDANDAESIDRNLLLDAVGRDRVDDVSLTEDEEEVEEGNGERREDEDDDALLLEFRGASFSWDIEDGVKYDDVNSEEKGVEKTGAGDGDEKMEKEERIDETASPAVIADIDLRLRRGDFIGVVGVVGAGKSSLLSAILGDLTLVKGEIKTGSDWKGLKVAFLPQEPWLQQTTIKENVLFGRDFDPDWFEKALKASQLKEDVETLPAGVDTQIGENGVTLSGGQKARVALARAVYADADVYVIDDPFAAVDPAVAKKLFHQCVEGVLKHKTKILCTHHQKYLKTASQVLAMSDGRVVKSGSPDQIFHDNAIADTVLEMQRRARLKSTESQGGGGGEGEAAAMAAGKFVEEEQKMAGVVNSRVYWTYLSYTGSGVGVFLVVATIVMYIFHSGQDVWMTHWLRQVGGGNGTRNSSVEEAWLFEGSGMDDNYRMTTEDDEMRAGNESWIPLQTSTDELKYYLGIYCGLFAAQFTTSCVVTCVFIRAGVESARRLHESLVDRILKAPLSFFASTPIGRIVNRFSSDMSDIDSHLANVINIMLQDAAMLAICVIVVCYGFPWFPVVLLPSICLYFVFQRFFRRASRETKRLESIAKSPIFSHFSDSLKGVTVIQAMRESPRFIDEIIEKIGAKAQAEFNSVALSGWLAFWLGIIAALVLCGVTFIAVGQHLAGGSSTAFAGLSITYALNFGWLTNELISIFTEAEKMMVGVERVLEYVVDTPLEEDNGECDNESVEANWPSRGVITYEDVVMTYRQDLRPALNGISFETAPGEKIGIVGRTGSGKSSLFNVLFRIDPLTSGRILIDGVDIHQISLHSLRSRLAIIPQDPYIFCGSIRQNLDVDGTCEDLDLWQVLEKVHLREKVTDLGGLDAEVPEGGTCFSVGQKQLLCLARAINKQTKILCVDEATANVDLETDGQIQQTLREEFSSCTVLVIAHRTETVADADRILEMSQGEIASLAPPLVRVR